MEQLSVQRHDHVQGAPGGGGLCRHHLERGGRGVESPQSRPVRMLSIFQRNLEGKKISEESILNLKFGSFSREFHLGSTL